MISCWKERGSRISGFAMGWLEKWDGEMKSKFSGFCSYMNSTTILKWERLTFKNRLSLWTHQSIDLETICTFDFFKNPVQNSGAQEYVSLNTVIIVLPLPLQVKFFFFLQTSGRWIKALNWVHWLLKFEVYFKSCAFHPSLFLSV